MILVSMCDGGGLRTIDDREIFPGDARGLAEWNGSVYFLRGAGRYERGLYRLDRDLNVHRVHAEAGDWHGMAPDDDGLLCTDSKRPYLWNPASRDREVLGLAGSGHINDVVRRDDGALLISRFQAGVIRSDGQKVHGPYNQPHTLVYDGKGRLWHCDSDQGRFLVDGQEWLKVDGYARGIAFDGDTVLAGVSRHRAASEKGNAYIMRHDIAGEIARYHFSGNQIYSILVASFATDRS